MKMWSLPGIAHATISAIMRAPTPLLPLPGEFVKRQRDEASRECDHLPRQIDINL